MKGPSLDAIKRFKEQQEIKKREDEERRLREKLIILEHRASQGDKKAKQNLKQIEKIKSDTSKSVSVVQKNKIERGHDTSKSQQHVVPKLKKVVPDFDELMKLARNNTNELRKDEPIQLPSQPLQSQFKSTTLSKSKIIVQKQCEREPQQSNSSKTKPSKQPKLPIIKSNATNSSVTLNSRQQVRKELNCGARRVRPNDVPPFVRQRYHRVNDLEDDDEYEQDDFVVDDDGDDVREELQQTLRSVFRYDRGRCDLREQELDREYRAIGRVSTFEDLEREERRASRLAAIEDAKAQREEDERKKMKRLKFRKN